MLRPWLELDGVEQRITEWSDAVDLDLVRLGTTADAEEIKDTAITQPLVVALALVAFDELRRRITPPADAPVTGHSVGELAAAAMAGVLDVDEAVSLAAVRGGAMARACALESTGMAAVMGGVPEAVLDRLAKLDLTPANINGAGQVVAAGPLAMVEKLAAEPPQDSKVIVLKVAGAFHTRYMSSAEDALRERTRDLVVADPGRPLLSNADGSVVGSGSEMLRRLVAQVTRPVRWDLCMTGLADLGVTATVELPPAGTLTGLVKRTLTGVTTLAMKSPADLDAVAELISEHEGSQ